MSGETTQGAFDVVVVVDTTGSMDSYILALQRFVPQLLALRSITSTSATNPIKRIGILSYTDYYTPPTFHPAQLSVINPVPTSDAAAKALIPRLKIEDVVSWSGWVDGKSGQGGAEVLIEWAKGLNAEGGGDYPEAAKTALKFLMGLIGASASAPGEKGDVVGGPKPTESEEHPSQPTRETLVLWYTDSPPHHRSHRSINRLLEIAAHNPPPDSRFTPIAPLINKEISTRALNQLAPHPEEADYQLEGHQHGESCTDWVHLCRAADEMGMTVYTILPPSMSDSDASFWVMLGETTGGGTCAIGGKRTVGGSAQEKALESYTTGGGDFVRAVIKLSVGVVLSALGDVVSSEEGAEMAIETNPKGKGKAVQGDTSLAGDEGDVHAPPELKEVRWLSHYVSDLVELLPDRKSMPSLQSNVEEAKKSDEVRGIARGLDIWAFVEAGSVPMDDQRVIKTELPTTSSRLSRIHPIRFLKRINKSLAVRLRGVHPSSSQKASKLPAGGVHITSQEENSLSQVSISTPLLPPLPEAAVVLVEDEGDASPAPLRVEDEENGSQSFLPPPWWGTERFRSEPELRQIQREGASQLGRHVLSSFEQSFTDIVNSSHQEPDDEGRYWDSVMVSLKAVVGADVEAISTIAIFAETWRRVSKMPPNNARDVLFSAYLAQANRIQDTTKKERLLRWADINHDASIEVSKLLESEESKAGSSENNSTERQILVIDDEASDLALTRERVLALTTSCDKKALKDAGYLLRYTKLAPPNDPTPFGRSLNLSNMDPPILFRVLPHLFIEGTLYSPRTASILAIIALTSHIPHLLEPAKAHLETSKGSWITAATPENFSTQFVGFILSVPSSQSVILSAEEHATYEGMSRYARLEDHIDTKIQAKVPWTPMKTRGVGDRKRLCDGCGIRRSETMMHQVGSYVLGNMKAEKEELEKKRDDGMRCGLCVDSDTKDPKDWKDRGEIESCWVECSERWCRAQYVIEDEEGLRIPPRCYYCRKRKPSPWIECTRCANRIILPKSYRVLPKDSVSSFVCPPCQNAEHTGHKTIVHKLTTLRSILFANEYEVGWLGMRPFREIFRGRSTFVIWELYGSETFTLLDPSLTPSPPISPSTAMERRKRLLLNGKKLLNPQELREELEEIVARATKKDRVLCGITFNYFSEEEVVPACGNNVCEFRASRTGLKEWYGGSGLRRKLCPSCRLLPTSEVAAVFGQSS